MKPLCVACSAKLVYTNLCSKQTDNAPKVRFRATVGEEPEIEVALVAF